MLFTPKTWKIKNNLAIETISRVSHRNLLQTVSSFETFCPHYSTDDDNHLLDTSGGENFTPREGRTLTAEADWNGNALVFYTISSVETLTIN